MNKKTTVSEAVQTDDYRESLIALRNTLAEELDKSDVPAVVKAQLAKQLRDTLADIQNIPDPGKFSGTPLDDILDGA